MNSSKEPWSDDAYVASFNAIAGANSEPPFSAEERSLAALRAEYEVLQTVHTVRQYAEEMFNYLRR